MDKYKQISKILKAISDPKRLEIIDMLSCGELCACDIQQHFNITQPTLSHDMKLLYEAGLINIRPQGKWNHYSLNTECFESLKGDLSDLFYSKKECICNKELR